MSDKHHPSSGPSVRGLRALVADDEASMRLLCRTNLEAEGMEVIEASDGAEAVTLAEHARPHVAVLDVWMPHLDGFGVGTRLREIHNGNFGLVFISAAPDEDFVRRVASLGGQFFPKPLDPVDFARIVRKIAESYEPLNS